jgi:hypothetical protein
MMMGFSLIGAINVVVVVDQLHLLGHVAITPESSRRLQRRGPAVMQSATVS